MRPNTGPMVFYDDIVGSSSSRSRASMLDEAARSQRIVAKAVPTIRDDMSIREDAVPVVHGGRTIAVVTRHANLTGGRTPSRLELTYRDLADSIMRMVAAGEFPSTSSPTGMRRGAPRVGDGVIHLDAEGLVKYASPNAVSAVHRMGHVGDVIGEVLAQVVTDLVSRNGANVDESLAVVATGRAAWRSEVETASATITMRAIPLTLGGVRTGAMVLVRDVSELRRREQELLTKDATIREIHHRVKNNLQTVAALLRLQARRVTDDAARASLEEAVRRVGTIALVHETLSQGFDETVNFDEIAVRGLRAVVEVATREHRVRADLHRQLRPDARRGRHRAGDDHLRAGAERRRARPRGPRRQGRGRGDPADPRRRRGAADRGDHRRRGGPAGRVPPVARRAGDPDRDVAGDRPQGPDPLGEQRAAAAPGSSSSRGCGRCARTGRRGWDGPSGDGGARWVSRRGGRGRCDA